MKTSPEVVVQEVIAVASALRAMVGWQVAGMSSTAAAQRGLSASALPRAHADTKSLVAVAQIDASVSH